MGVVPHAAPIAINIHTVPDRDEQLSPRGGILTIKFFNYELISYCRTPERRKVHSF